MPSNRNKYKSIKINAETELNIALKEAELPLIENVRNANIVE